MININFVKFFEEIILIIGGKITLTKNIESVRNFFIVTRNFILSMTNFILTLTNQ